TETGPLAASAVPLPAGVGGGGGGGGARASFFLVTHPLPVPPPQAGEGTLGQEPAPCRNRPLLLLGVFCHAGAAGVDLDVAPGVAPQISRPPCCTLPAPGHARRSCPRHAARSSASPARKRRARKQGPPRFC